MYDILENRSNYTDLIDNNSFRSNYLYIKMSTVTFEQLPRELIMQIYDHLSNTDMLNMLTLDHRVCGKTRAVYWIKLGQAIFMRDFGIDASSVNNSDLYFMAKRLIMVGMDVGYHQDIYLNLLTDYLAEPPDENREIFQRILSLITDNNNNRDRFIDTYQLEDFYDDEDIMESLLHMNPLEVYLVTGLRSLFSPHTFYPKRTDGALTTSFNNYPALRTQIHSRDIKLQISRRDYISALNNYVSDMYYGVDVEYCRSIFESLLDYLKTINLQVSDLSIEQKSRLKRILLTYRRLRRCQCQQDEREEDHDWYKGDERLDFFMAGLSVLFIDPQI